MSTAKRLRYLSFLILGVIIGGTLGFELIEGWGILDSLYMTVITISTVGFQEVHRLSPAGRGFSIALIIVGVGATFYGLTVFFELLVEGQIRGLMGKRKMERGLRRMKEHHIVCGYGRVGRRVVDELRRRHKKIVVIESAPALQEQMNESKIAFVPGDATEDKALEAAGIQAARCLVVSLPNQADNVLITLTARQMNPSLRIVARADEDGADKKLRLAGADAVVCPHETGGMRMAIASVSPNVLDFMEIAGGDDSGIGVDEINIDQGSELCGTTLRDSPISSKLGLTVVALRKAGGTMRFNPDASEQMDANDILIVIGPPDKLGTLRELTAAPA
jgi:voltage-gated potassium channel